VTLRADVGEPAPVATAPSRQVWSRLLGPGSIDLRWTATDDQPGPVQVTVVVFDLFGTAVRHLDAGTVTVTAPGQVVYGSTSWDGKTEACGTSFPWASTTTGWSPPTRPAMSPRAASPDRHHPAPVT